MPNPTSTLYVDSPHVISEFPDFTTGMLDCLLKEMDED